MIVSKSHVDAINSQSEGMKIDVTAAEEAKKQLRDKKAEFLKEKIERIDSQLESNIKCMVDQSRDKGASHG